mgnify:CR=1 FL=1
MHVLRWVQAELQKSLRAYEEDEDQDAYYVVEDVERILQYINQGK